MNILMKKYHRKLFFKIRLSSTILGILLSLGVLASNPETKLSIFDVLNYQEVLKAELETDLETLKSDRYLTEGIPAKFTFKDKNGEKQSWNIKVEQRGKFRRLHCSELPPLKLNFKKKDLEVAGLALWDDMKLVTHCLSDPYDAKELIMKEYLSYKLFNELSPESFRVQLIKINYIDSNSGQKTQEWGILIEDTAQLKARLNAESCDGCYNLPIDQFAQDQLQVVSLFQYLIGNSDWDLKNTRNVKLLKTGEKIIPIPYDFDFSGIVNASYALPNGRYKMASIRDRIYLGFTESIDDMEEMKKHFFQKEGDLLHITRSFKPLSLNSRLEVITYLKSFFKEDIYDIQIGEEKSSQMLSEPKR